MVISINDKITMGVTPFYVLLNMASGGYFMNYYAVNS
jgi:hypothetical protein